MPTQHTDGATLHKDAIVFVGVDLELKITFYFSTNSFIFVVAYSDASHRAQRVVWTSELVSYSEGNAII